MASLHTHTVCRALMPRDVPRDQRVVGSNPTLGSLFPLKKVVLSVC